MTLLSVPRSTLSSSSYTYVEFSIGVLSSFPHSAFLIIVPEVGGAFSLAQDGREVATAVGVSGVEMRIGPLDVSGGTRSVAVRLTGPEQKYYFHNATQVADSNVSVSGFNTNSGSFPGFTVSATLEYLGKPPPDEFVPFNEDKFVSAYVVDGTLDGWFQQPFWPVAETPLSQWLMAEVGYEKPEPANVPIYRPPHGQGWPVWAANPSLNVERVSELEALLSAHGIAY